MLIEIETSQLGFMRDSQSYRNVDDLEDDVHRYPRKCITRDDAEGLDAELTETTAVEQAVRGRAQSGLAEKPDGKCSPNAA